MKKLLLSAVLALAGCGGGSKKSGTTPTPPEGGGGGATIAVEDQKGGGTPEEGPDCTKVAPLTDAEAETDGLALVDQMGAIFSANPTDCKAMAIAINDWSADNQDLMNRMNCYTRSLPEDRKAAFEQKAQARFEVHSQNMMVALENCGEDELFQQAMEEAVK